MVAFTERTVSYDNNKKQISYITAGPASGPLLIFIHGWPAIASTWKPQLECFANLGFYAIAPDMPGYGRSTANKVTEDYALSSINTGLLALLADTGRSEAIWLGHDWGSGVVSCLAATHPEVCRAMVWMAVPYGTIEYGKEELVKYINRDVHPADKYPDGQWDYQTFYEENFEKATDWFDENSDAFLRAIYGSGRPEGLGKPTITSTVRADGGWLGGGPPPEIPLQHTLLSEELYTDLSKAMKKTTFWPADAYYMNHTRNREYILKNRKNDGILEFPCLFVQARYDTICDTVTTRLLEPMRKMCKNFTFSNVDAGHWVALDKPVETNAIVVKWLVKEVEAEWPGALQNATWSNKL